MHKSIRSNHFAFILSMHAHARTRLRYDHSFWNGSTFTSISKMYNNCPRSLSTMFVFLHVYIFFFSFLRMLFIANMNGNQWMRLTINIFGCRTSSTPIEPKRQLGVVQFFHSVPFFFHFFPSFECMPKQFVVVNRWEKKYSVPFMVLEWLDQ